MNATTASMLVGLYIAAVWLFLALVVAAVIGFNSYQQRPRTPARSNLTMHTLTDFLWRVLARFLAKPAISCWLIERAQRTPYTHIQSAHGSDVYMYRWWLFNAYDIGSEGKGRRFPISIRIHHIMRPDHDRHLHDHPWNARTIILRGAYWETRKNLDEPGGMNKFCRRPGDTSTLRFNEFHRINSVSPGGVWTLFITGKYRGTWGFDVDGIKVPYRQYLQQAAATTSD